MKGKIAERAEQDVLIEMKDNSKRNVKKTIQPLTPLSGCTAPRGWVATTEGVLAEKEGDTCVNGLR